MFDNQMDLNNTVTCYFMYLIGLKVKVAVNELLTIFSPELTHLKRTKKTLGWRREYGTPRNRYLLTAKRCGRSLKQRRKEMDRNV